MKIRNKYADFHFQPLRKWYNIPPNFVYSKLLMLWRQILCVTTRLESFPMGQWFRSSTGELQSVLRIVPGNFIAIKYFWCPWQESHSPESWNNRTPEASQYSPAKQQGPLCFLRKVGGEPQKGSRELLKHNFLPRPAGSECKNW